MRLIPLIAGCILLVFLMIPVQAFDIREGENLSIDEPVYDDLLVSAGVLTVNAPVKSLTFAGGALTVNAPIEGNLIAAGGQLEINAPIGADIIAAGGDIRITGDVTGKVLAAGGTIAMDGKTSNLVISGGTVDLGENSHVTGDAIVSSSGYTARGDVEGNLIAEGDEGGSGPSFDLSQVGSIIAGILVVVKILCAIGMLIFGVVLTKLIPGPFTSVVNAIEKKPLISLVIGLAGIIIAGIVGAILLVTIIGIPIAVIIALGLLLALITAELYSGAALGSLIAQKTGKTLSLTLSFVIGFILLQILLLIPFGIGSVFGFIAVLLGTGALITTTWDAIQAHP
ncbi:MAG TPA: hypothetical protein VN372_03940 [Methanospirillum sp.]|nr:hypothetical protein [Methanospirillum sp.]